MTKAGKGGRPARPTALKVLEGERPSRIAKNEPKPDPTSEVPVAPEWLAADSRGVWDRLAPLLHDKGVLTPWDEDAFGAYCEAVVHHRDACRVVDRDGVTVRGERGLVKNPALQVVRDNAQLLRGFAQEFGLTPSSRSGIELREDGRSGDTRGLLS